jgi:hypothetical protein
LWWVRTIPARSTLLGRLAGELGGDLVGRGLGGRHDTFRWFRCGASDARQEVLLVRFERDRGTAGERSDIRVGAALVELLDSDDRGLDDLVRLGREARRALTGLMASSLPGMM